MATRAEIRAVQRIIYDDRRTKKLSTEIESIVVLMNLDPGRALPSDDARVQAGSGPLWYIPATGKLTPAVLEAADRCDRVAEILTKMRRDLADVKVNKSDRRHLREALEQQAKGWRKRATSWRDPGRPGASIAKGIAEHERNSAEELKKVNAYLEVKIR